MSRSVIRPVQAGCCFHWRRSCPVPANAATLHERVRGETWHAARIPTLNLLCGSLRTVNLGFAMCGQPVNGGEELHAVGRLEACNQILDLLETLLRILVAGQKFARRLR